MMSEKKMYSIGQMAKISNASPKQLRYLEGKGLLVPALRDKNNNYRYYSAEQFNRLAYIKTLRDLGFSFEDVITILDANDKNFFLSALHKQIALAHEEVKNAYLAHERLSNYAFHLLNASLYTNGIDLQNIQRNKKNHTYTVIDIPEQPVIFIRKKAAATSAQLFIDRYFSLQRICIDKGMLPSGSLHAIFHDGYFKQFDSVNEDLETFFPVSTDRPLKKYSRTVGGFKGISTIHLGPYQNMKKLYAQMEAWGKKQSLQLMNLSIEKYILGPDMTTNSQKFITQLIIPLAGSKV